MAGCILLMEHVNINEKVDNYTAFESILACLDPKVVFCKVIDS